MENENEILMKFSKLNTYSDEFNYSESIKGTKFKRFIIPSWMSGYNSDIWVDSLHMRRELNKIGLTCQLYYDIMNLRISDISQRPICECPGCNNFTKYTNFSRGYLKHCSRSCSTIDDDLNPVKNLKLRNTFCISRKGRNNSDLHKMKCSRKLKGRVISEETRRKMSETMLKKYENPEEILKRIQSKSNNSRVKKGWISINKCKERIYYGSSWEKYLIELCECSDEVKEVFRCKVLHYSFNNEDRRYLPDLLVKLNNDKFILFEVKPSHELNDPKVKAKAEAGISYCKDNNMEYRFFTEKDIKLAKSGLYKFIKDN